MAGSGWLKLPLNVTNENDEDVFHSLEVVLDMNNTLSSNVGCGAMKS